MIDKIKEEQKDPFKTEFTDDRVTDAADSVAPENLETLEEKLKSYNEIQIGRASCRERV